MNSRISTVRRLTLAAVTFAVATGCASGESIINAGNDGTRPTTTGPSTGTGPSTTIALGGTIPLGGTVPLVASTVSLLPTTIPLVASTIALPTVADARGFAGSSRTAAPPDIAPCPVAALDERDPADGPVEITFWHAMTAASEEALVALTDEYNASQERVHVTLGNQNGYNELTSKYFLSNESDRPHVVQMPEFMTQQMADANAAIPAGACIQAEGLDLEPFLDRALLAYQTGGIQWSMPFNASTPVLYYNRAMLEEAGLDPDDPPVSLEDFRAYADAIVESGAAPLGIAFDHGVNSGGGWFLEQWLARLGMPYADNQNGRAGRATQVVFNTPEVVEMLELVQAMVVDGVAVDVGDNAGATDVLFKLADETEPAAMGITTSGGLGIVISVLSSGQVPHLSVDDFGVGPLPGPSDTPGALVGGASLYITRDKGDAEAAAAWDFIKFLTTAESQSTWAAATGYVPIREDAAELDPLAQTYADDPRFRVAFDQLTAGSDDFSSVGPVLGPLQEIREVTARMMATIFAGGDVEAALTDATEQANALIADYNARN